MSSFDFGLTPSRLLRTTAAVFAAAIVGPFETGARLDFGERLVFWAAVIGASGIFFLVIWRGVSAAGARLDWPEPVRTEIAPVIAALLFAWPLPPIVAWIGRLAMGSDVDVDPFSVWLSATALALLIWFVQFALRMLAQRGGASAQGPESSTTKSLPQIILRAGLRSISDVACIEAQDHYLRVTDISGANQLVLYRFADAVAELGDAGEQVHRSFWVAAHAVVQVERRGKRMELLLTNGLRAPVSDTFMNTVKSKGWAKSKTLDKGRCAGREITRSA